MDKLHACGVTASFATNNIQNLFTFTGDGDVLKIGTLLCQVLQMTSNAQAGVVLEMGSTVAAKAIGVESHRLGVGCPANFVLLGAADSALKVLASPPLERIVVRQGRVISKSSFKSTLIPPS